ncbi:hypothetical protein [Streptomyces sp. FH025]|uniref:hypothetical protein n=1 Tax=Streptomyces sp. FH025 TaxID=2815937 RepID=UPI001A9D7169|nr:hypothetical protein [Streptomyces sp. FH025]MBO1420154.1 hypothetical protein [Streptomyces sp. FH025]
MTPSTNFVPLAARRTGLWVRTYQVDAEGRRYNVSPPIEVIPEPDPPTVELRLDFWPDCTCPQHSSG